jgi:hypothetical protein
MPHKNAEKVRLVYIECGHHFNRAIGPRTYEIPCPKCHGVDVEPEPILNIAAHSTLAGRSQ